MTNADESISKMLQEFNFEMMLFADWAWASYLGTLLRGSASLPCFVLLVLLMAAAKMLAVKAGTCIDLARLPSQPACLVWV